MTSNDTSAALDRVIQIYAGESKNGFLNLKSVAREDFRFRDPFCDISGFDKVMAHFGELAGQHARMVWDIGGKAVCGRSAYLRWHYTTDYIDGSRTDFEGMSEFIFDEEGRFAAHVDHFDGLAVILQKRPDMADRVAALREGFHV